MTETACWDCSGVRSVPAQGYEPAEDVDNGQVVCPTCQGRGVLSRPVLDVFIPAGEGPWSIDPGSGIVGTIEPAIVGNDPDVLVVDYEGNRYNAVNIITYADRVAHAAGRHVTKYPTAARAWVSPGSMIQVGEFDPTTGVVTLTAERLVLDWCSLTEDQLDAELLTTAYRDVMARERSH